MKKPAYKWIALFFSIVRQNSRVVASSTPRSQAEEIQAELSTRHAAD